MGVFFVLIHLSCSRCFPFHRSPRSPLPVETPTLLGQSPGWGFPTGKLGIMANPGVAPLNPATPVGQVRLNLGDTTYVPLDPPVEGQGDYNNFSDDAIEGFIAAASGNPASATGYGYLQLAALAALSSGTIQTDDLMVRQENRATELRQIAAAWFGRGADADSEAGLNEYFNIVPYGGYIHPELSTFPTHWGY